MTRRLCFALVCLYALTIAACSGGGSDDGATPQAGGTRPAGTVPGVAEGSGDGSLIMTQADGIYEFDLDSGDATPLIVAEVANTFFLDPTVSPNGDTIAYIVQAPPVVSEGSYDAGTDLWIANRDGSDARVLFEHAVPNQLVRFPQWGDYEHVFAIIQEITVGDGITSVVYTLQSIDVATGERERVLENALSFTVSPDGDRVAYAKLSREIGETFELVNVDGTGAETLVPVAQNLAPFNSPRYSPDGAMIAFASADQTGAQADIRYASAVGAARASRPPLDGLPQDIWTVDAQGGTPRRVADLKEDLPALTWSGDGEHIYVLGVAGLYDVDLTSGATTRIGEGFFHGQLDWVP